MHVLVAELSAPAFAQVLIDKAAKATVVQWATTTKPNDSSAFVVRALAMVCTGTSRR
jgi:hypothetical protein